MGEVRIDSNGRVGVSRADQRRKVPFNIIVAEEQNQLQIEWEIF